MIPNGTIKLFVDAHVFDDEHQGSRTFIKELYQHLTENKEIDFYFGAYDIKNLQQYFTSSGNIHFVKYKYRGSISRLLFDIPAIIKKYGIQYAHFQYIVPLTKNCRFIVTTHDVLFNEYPQDFSLWYRFNKNLLYKMGAKKADILTTVSLHSKNAIQKYLGIGAEHVHVLPNGIHPKYFADYNKGEAVEFINQQYGFKKFILFVSRIEPRKNHVALLQSYTDLQLDQQDYHLVFIGHESIKTPAFDALLNSVNENIRRHVHVIDSVSDDELLNFYKAATAFVYPSKAEGFGFPPLEAAALKVPVLCSNSAALEDFSFFGGNHITVSDHDLFKSKLKAIIHCDQQNELVAISGTIQQRFNWQKTADEFFSLLKHNSSI